MMEGAMNRGQIRLPSRLHRHTVLISHTRCRTRHYDHFLLLKSSNSSSHLMRSKQSLNTSILNRSWRLRRPWCGTRRTGRNTDKRMTTNFKATSRSTSKMLDSKLFTMIISTRLIQAIPSACYSFYLTSARWAYIYSQIYENSKYGGSTWRTIQATKRTASCGLRGCACPRVYRERRKEFDELGGKRKKKKRDPPAPRDRQAKETVILSYDTH